MNDPQQTLDDENLAFVNKRSAEIGKELHLINMRFNGNFEKVAHEIGRILSEIEFTARILNEQVEFLLSEQKGNALVFEELHREHDEVLTEFAGRISELEGTEVVSEIQQDSIGVLTQRVNKLEKTSADGNISCHNRIKKLETAFTNATQKEAVEKSITLSMPKKGDTKL